MSLDLMVDGDYIVEVFNSSGVASIRIYPIKDYYNPITYKISEFKAIYSDYVAEFLSENISGTEVFLNVSRDFNGDLLLKWNDF